MSMSAPYIRPGRLRVRASLESRSEVADSGGGYSYTWAEERKIWCAIRIGGGKEAVAAMREQESITAEIWVRYASDFSPDKRITYNGRVWNIRAVLNPREQNEFLRLFCEEGVAT